MKKIVAMILAVALVLGGLYPSQLVEAAEPVTTTGTGQGLSFYTDQYGPYVAEKALSTTPMTFEMLVKCNNNKNANGSYAWYRNGIVLSNTDLSTPGTFDFGFAPGNRPMVTFIDDDGVKDERIFAKPGAYDSSDNTDKYNKTFLTGTYLHIAIVNDIVNDQMVCYLNGEEWATSAGAFKGTLTPSLPLCLGGDYREGNTMQFRGAIKSAAIFSDARTAAEVKSDYSNGVTGSTSGVLAAYNVGLSSYGAEYPATISDLTGNYNLTRTKYDYLTETQAKGLSGRGDYDFSLAVVGDPQCLAAYEAKGSYTGSMNKMYQWIRDNVSSRKIQYVLNMGDTTGSYEEIYEDAEWKIGAAAVKQLDGYVPYSIIRGNHDATEKYLEHFSWSDYSDTVSGSYENNMLTTYQKFEVSGIKYMLVNLDFGVAEDKTKADKIIRWANDLIASNPEYNVIITTHAYMSDTGEVMYGGMGGAASNYGMAKDGKDIWDELACQHENVVMVLNGHNGLGDVLKREDKGLHGNTVVQMLVNPQIVDQHLGTMDFDMLGAVTMLYFSNGGKTVHVENYSTLRDSYYGSANQFSFTLNQAEDSVIKHENGSVALAYEMLDTTNAIPVPTVTEYKDYLFAGWYKGAGCTIETAITNKTEATEGCYAKFIPADVLTVKAQVSTSTISSGDYAGNWAMRFVSSVESANYRNVGFKVTNGSEVFTSSQADIYTKIASTEAEVDYSFSPQVISKNSEYFFTAKLAVADTDAAKATDYTVQAFIQTFDGTIIYGPKRVVCVNDGISGTSLNMAIKADLNGSDYTATLVTGNYANQTQNPVAVTLLPSDAGYTNIRIPVAASGLNSATKVIIKDAAGVEVATDVYRNYYTDHETYEGATWNNEDYSWHYVDENATDVILGSSADLYGLYRLAEWGETFAGKTIYLVRDIEVNEGTAVAGNGSAAPTWEADGKITNWVPIKNFYGTLDGNGNTISGLYIEGDSEKTGFFKTLSSEAEILNLGIVNSYIKTNNNDHAGVLAGHSYAKRIENVYSDALIDGGNLTGGLVGTVQPSSATTEIIFEKCWFDGEIYISGYGASTGGLVGYMWDDVNGKIRFTDCLFSGDLYECGTYSWPNSGGIVGSTHGDQAGKTTVTFENCLNVGTMSSATHGTGGFGGICAYMNKGLTGSTGTNCWSVSGNAYSYNCPDGGDLSFSNSSIVDRSELFCITEDELFEKLSLLSGQKESAWMCDIASNDTGRGTPILKDFAYLWMEANPEKYDTRWYREDETEYTISTKEALNGLALVAANTNFEGTTIKLGANITLNSGKAADWAEAAPDNVWSPIPEFAGTFDGQGYTISGVYIDGNSANTGFFKSLTATAEVKNLGIINSYIENADNDTTGALAGHSFAKRIANVYSNAIIIGSNATGGLVGIAQPTSADTELVFEQCWFDGKVDVTGYGASAGGIVGYMWDNVSGKIRFTDCLFSGELNDKGTCGGDSWGGNWGGIVGTTHASQTGDTTVTFENCLNVGIMTSIHGTGGFGGICAWMNKALVASTGTNCYAVSGSAYTNICPNGGDLKFTNYGVVARDTLLCKTESQLLAKLPLLSGQSESAWVCDSTSNNTDRGTPILKVFAGVWKYIKATQ